jgi:hypothetical protein
MKVFPVLVCILFLSLSSVSQTLLQNNKLPKDLQISLDVTGTVQFANYYRYSIEANGAVSMEYTSRGLPVTKGFNYLLIPLGEKPKKVIVPTPPKKKEKLSRNQLKELVRAFESSGFFSMNDSYYGDPTTVNGMCTNHADAKALSITANGKTKRVYFFLGCTYSENTPLKNFLEHFDKVQRVLKDVKIRETGS